MDLFPNSTLPTMWLIFMAVFVCLNQLVFKPTLEILEKRRNQGEGLEEKSKALNEENQQKLVSYQTQITEARYAAGLAREAILKSARDEERRMVEAARQVAEARLKELRFVIEKEKQEAMGQLKKDVTTLSAEMVKRIVSG